MTGHLLCKVWIPNLGSKQGLDIKIHPQILLCKKKIPVTLKYRHMHVVLNVDEIKN
jgi:hypothetical protein